MLHQVVLQDLLEDECARARERLGDRIQDLSLRDGIVYCGFTVPGRGEYRLRLDGRHYDAEPFRVAVVDADDNILPPPGWPPGLCLGYHPVLGVPCVCVRGCYEYHVHTSHLADVWDRYRHKIRLADLLDHLVRRSGR